ncbi:TetR/AcrR family transcriptional regulator [Williamsia serinedens]|uniref:Transcriptional regulator, TetR family n=1 Tax=Williamsia serinedens TaxID=391736 RepID=A0ABT1GZI1_9NOCA|nr:TetR/AcrR family transcriptional regulator [Williamsia serinedens]MCP2160276.1 transcriptional regulator, TetR family [Williamsia serinedens]
MSSQGSTVDLTPGARRILDTASRLFYERGIHAVGVDTIADEAGVTKRTLYNRFGSKDVLVEQYLRGRDQRWLALRTAAVDAAGPDPIDRLRAVFDASAGWSDSDGGRGCGFTKAHAEFSDPAHPVAQLVAAQKQELLELFRGVLADAGVVDDHLAQAVLALHEGALVAHGVGVGADPWVSAREAAVRLASGA